MNTATVLHQESNTPHLTGAAIYIAPARFDVHAIDALARWADAALTNATSVVIDLRMVDFMDNQMVNELDNLRATAIRHGVAVELVNLSAAAALTFDLLQRAAA